MYHITAPEYWRRRRWRRIGRRIASWVGRRIDSRIGRGIRRGIISWAGRRIRRRRGTFGTGATLFRVALAQFHFIAIIFIAFRFNALFSARIHICVIFIIEIVVRLLVVIVDRLNPFCCTFVICRQDCAPLEERQVIFDRQRGRQQTSNEKAAHR